MGQALFTLSKGGRLSLAEDGDMASVGGCNISDAIVSGEGMVSGVIVRRIPTKKILDIPGFYEFHATESFSFYFESPCSGELWDTLADHFFYQKQFKLKVVK